MTLLERTLARGFWTLARRVYEFLPRVLHFNRHGALRILLSASRFIELSQEMFEHNPQRNELIRARIPESRARQDEQGHALPIELTAIYGSREHYQMLLPHHLETLENPDTQRELFTSLVDYAVRFSPHLVNVIQQDAFNHTSISIPELIELTLRRGYVETAEHLSSHFQQQGALNQTDLLDVIINTVVHYLRQSNTELIRHFFVNSGGLFNQLGPAERATLQTRLIEEVLMQSVRRLETEDRPHDDVSFALLDHIKGYTPEQRDRLLAEARASGQVHTGNRLQLYSYETFEVTDSESEQEMEPQPGPSRKKPRHK